MKRISKIYVCKVGTLPSEIRLKHNYKIEVGKQIAYRFEREHNWQEGEIWKVNDDGYFFVRRL